MTKETITAKRVTSLRRSGSSDVIVDPVLTVDAEAVFQANGDHPASEDFLLLEDGEPLELE